MLAFEVLLLGWRLDPGNELFFVLEGAALPLKDQVCSLGVLLDLGLPLDKQVAEVARGAFQQLQVVSQLWPFLDWKLYALVASTLDYCNVSIVIFKPSWPKRKMAYRLDIPSRLDYCNTLCMGLLLTAVQKLQLVQNEYCGTQGPYQSSTALPTLFNLLLGSIQSAGIDFWSPV